MEFRKYFLFHRVKHLVYINGNKMYLQQTVLYCAYMSDICILYIHACALHSMCSRMRTVQKAWNFNDGMNGLNITG